MKNYCKLPILKTVENQITNGIEVGVKELDNEKEMKSI